VFPRQIPEVQAALMSLQREAHKRNLMIGGGVGAAVVLLIIVKASTAPMTRSGDSAASAEPVVSSTQPVVPAKVTERVARYYGEQCVKQGLKAPSTAEFSGVEGVPIKENAFQVSGTVDAQNAFGAMLRQRFLVTVSYDPTTTNWTCETAPVFE
jgi:hypothetical protein